MTNEKRIEIEKRIARRVVTDALEAGYMISVWEGGDWAIKRAVNKAAMIMDAMFSTDSDLLVLRKLDGEIVGRVYLVWGNGCDVLSDWSDNEATNELLKGALAVSEKAEA